MKFNKCLIAFISIFIFSNNLFSEEVVKQISSIQGLSNNSINYLFEDSYQTIWIGTWDGLNAYDGNSIKTFRFSQDNPNSISNNIIREIVQSDDNSLWISTDFGINKWNYKEESFTRYYLGTKDKGAAHEAAYQIQKDSDNNLYCYVANSGFFKYNKEQNDFDRITLPFDQHIKSFVIHQNTIFFQYKDKTVGYIPLKNLTEKTSAVNLSYIASFESLDKMIYTPKYLIALLKDRISIFDLDNKTEQIILSNNTDKISSIYYDKEVFYIATYQNGLNKYRLEDGKFMLISSKLDQARLTFICKGSQDILWLGSDGQGVFQIYNDNSSFPMTYSPFPVRAFCEINPKEILVGTKGAGIKLYNKETKKLSSFADEGNGLLSNSVYSFAKNSRGDIFIGSDGNGLNVLYQNEKKIKPVLSQTRYPFLKSIYSLHFSDNDSILWIGTAGYGLLRSKIKFANGNYHLTAIKQFATSSQDIPIKNDIVYTITEDKNGKIWFGTRGGGVYIINPENEVIKHLEDIYKDIHLTNSDILSLYYDNQYMWIGTSYGLNRLHISENANLTKYTDKNGIKNNTIHGVLKDKEGNIWISTNGGISKISDNNIINYTMNEGLQSNEFSDGSYFSTQDGELYFGGVNGFNYFVPANISFRSYQPPLELNSLSIYNTEYSVNETIKDNTLSLSYDERFVSLSFVCKEFIDNPSCEYAYRIKGESDEWIMLGTSPKITFSNLTPGKHLLEVKNTNGDKIWNDNIFQMTIQVGYPWWLSLPAIIAYIVVFLTIIYITNTVIRNRIRLSRRLFIEQQERKLQQETHEHKLEFFTNVAHEFFTPLTLIYTPAQYLIDNVQLPSEAKRYIHIIRNNAERLQKLISELMEFRKAKSGYTSLYPEQIETELLIDYIADNYTEVLNENRIDFSIDKNSLGTFYSDKSSLEKILLNLISNAYKYTPRGGYIYISMRQDENRTLHFLIRNSGKGLSDEKIQNIFNRFEIYNTPNVQGAESTGVGLNLTKSLIELLGGSIAVSSKLGEYAQFDFTLPELTNSIHKTTGKQPENFGQTNHYIFPINFSDPQKNIKILLVEDERNIREIMKDILSDQFTIIEVNDGDEACEVIKKDHPDMIITDIMMPNMNGTQLIQNIKSDQLTSHIPIIGISAKTALEDYISAYEHGADMYLSKPFHPSHLLSVVNNMLKKQERLKEYFNSPISSHSLVGGKILHNEENEFLKKVIEYVSNNIDDEELGAESLSNFLAISKASLYRNLREINGQTPSELIRSIRLEYASKLLTSTQLTVSEIITKCGFSNRSYFYREFAKKFGMSPSEYKEKSYTNMSKQE